MITPVLLICIVLLLFSTTEVKEKKRKIFLYRFLYFVFCILLCFIIAYRSPLTSDYENYEMFYYSGVDRFETGFVLLGNICKSLNLKLIPFFFVCAFIAISIKFYALSKMTNLVFAALLVYISNLFILQENIQIRCSIAAALVLLAVYFSVERKLIGFLISVTLAVLFHNTAIIVYPLWFISNNNDHLKYYILMIPLAYALYAFSLTLGRFIQFIPIAPIQDFWTYYISLLDKGIGHVDVNVFNALQLTKCVICVLLFSFANKISSHNKYFTVCLKIYIISAVLYVILSDFPVAADRLSEFLSVVEIIALPCVMYISKNKIVGWAIIAFWASTHLFVHISLLHHLL